MGSHRRTTGGLRPLAAALLLMFAGACGSRGAPALDGAAGDGRRGGDGSRDGAVLDAPVDGCLAPTAAVKPWAISVAGTGRNMGRGIQVDCAGGSVVIGNFQGPAHFGATKLTSFLDHRSPHMLTSDVFVGRLDRAGRWLWAVNAGGSGSDSGTGISMDDAGNIYVAGNIYGTALFGKIMLASKDLHRAFVAKLDRGGKWLWARPSGVNVGGISTDGAGNSTITGSFGDKVSFGSTALIPKGKDDAFVARLDSSGKWRWAVSAGGAGNDRGNAVSLDSAGNSLVTGGFEDKASFGSTALTAKGGQDLFVAKLDSAGRWLWARSAGGSGGPSPVYTLGRGISVDSAGSSLVTGDLTGTASFGATTLTAIPSWKGAVPKDVFVARLDGAGKWLWARTAGGDHQDSGLAIQADRAGNGHVTGTFSGTASFGSITLAATVYDSLFVARVDSAGKWLWARAGGCGYGSGIAVGPAGGTFVTGGFEDTASFGATKLTSQRFTDIFVWRIGRDGR